MSKICTQETNDRFLKFFQCTQEVKGHKWLIQLVLLVFITFHPYYCSSSYLTNTQKIKA